METERENRLILLISRFLNISEEKQISGKSVGILQTRRIALVVVLTALAVALSPFNIPIGATKCFPAQHMVNAMTGILLGPWYAVLVAITVGTIRIGLGLGTLFAYPGGIFGGLVVGLLYRYIRMTDWVALLEPLGTVVIGATVSALLVAPMVGSSMTVYALWVAFAASSIPGSVLGLIILKALRRSGLDKYFR